MNFLEKRKWRRFMEGSDYPIAAQLLVSQFKGAVIPDQLAATLDAYLANPGLETAVELVKFDGKFVAVFELSKSPLTKALVSQSDNDNSTADS